MTRHTTYKGYDITWQRVPAHRYTEAIVRKDGQLIDYYDLLSEARAAIDQMTGTPSVRPVSPKTKVTVDGTVYEIPTRDSQRTKAYRAERAVCWGVDHRGAMNLEQCQEFTNQVVGSGFWRHLTTSHGKSMNVVKVEQIRKPGAHALPYFGKIGISQDMMSRHVMLHELAHVACPPGVGHHWPWARAYAMLAAEFMDPDMGARLRYEFTQRRVRFMP